MTVVIDVGCARYGGDYSLERLVEEFNPQWLYGFDPNNEIVASAPADWERVDATGLEERRHLLMNALTYRTPSGCFVQLLQAAAWIYDGTIGYRSETLNSWVTDLKGAPQVPCFDLADFIYRVPPATHGLDGLRNMVLKIDAEGSEYDLLRHLMSKGMDKILHFTWVEWHEPDRGRAKIEEEWDGELAEWRW